jgi:hypothetical protein
VRTTVNIHDGLLETAKCRAKERGLTLGEVLEQALQHYLASSESVPTGPPLPVFRASGGLLPGIDPTSNASLFEAAYAEEDAAHAARIRG